MSEQSHDYYINSACSYAEGMVDDLQKLQLNFNEAIAKVERKYGGVLRARDKLRIAEKQILRIKERTLEKECKGLRNEVAELKLKLEKYEGGGKVQDSDKVPVAKATTLAIYDSIIFAICNWSTDGQSAPDIELVCQSVLFPCIYQKVMEGLEDYYLDSVPASAMLVVQRGREYVKHLRSIEDRFITDELVWEQHAPMIQEWWVNDALPLLYGARDDDWDNIIPKTLDEMLVWRDQPASRALDFPLVWDGMELVKTHSEDIREHSELPEFNKQQVTTRLEP
jgi:hypothetical protein